MTWVKFMGFDEKGRANFSRKDALKEMAQQGEYKTTKLPLRKSGSFFIIKPVGRRHASAGHLRN